MSRFLGSLAITAGILLLVYQVTQPQQGSTIQQIQND